MAASAPAAADEERIPPLRPPLGPVPPGVWEQYGVWLVAGGCVALLLLAAAIWLFLRPKPAVVMPPETVARRALESLCREPETGAVLSRVSQVVRSYFGAVFGLPPGELTTAEFCRSLSAAQDPGPDLARQVSAFLRECDERKFAPSPPPAPMEAVTRAAGLVANAEARRAQLRAVATGSQPEGPGQSPEPGRTSPGTSTA